MTLDVHTAQPPADPPSAGTAVNAEVIARIRRHHGELAAELHRRTAAALAAAARGELGAERDALHDWYRGELMPHIVAEEQTLYRAGDRLEATRLLVASMSAEHQALAGLVAELALARGPLDSALAAASAQALLGAHLGKENDLLLPALDAAGVELGPLLDGMHALLGTELPADGGDGCGCGCGHGDDAVDDRRVPVSGEITAAPVGGEPQASAVPAVDGAALDVRVLPHGQRHEIIFGRLDALGAGESLLIVNDHDPKPLRYQTEALWPDEFEWSYREAGPHVWQVAITRAG